MSVNFGNSAMNMFYLGNSPMRYIYQGDALIWPTASIAPAPEYYFEVYGYTGNLTAMSTKLDGATFSSVINVNGNTFLTSSTTYNLNSRAFDGTGDTAAVTKVYATGLLEVGNRGITTFNLQQVILPDTLIVYGEPSQGAGISPQSGTNFNTLYLPKAVGNGGTGIIAPGNSTNGTLTIKATGGPFPFGRPFPINDLTAFTQRFWTFVEV
jgi:hypothetical protein